MTSYRAAVIGLGWTGLLYDLAPRSEERFHVDDVDRPTPDLDIHRRFHHHDHPGDEGNPTSCCEALQDRPETELVAAADRDRKRLDVFTERYGIDATYTDAEQMLKEVQPEIVAVATNTRHRADLTCLAVECGAKGIFTEKPMADTLDEVDRMVNTCAEAGVPLNCGAISTTHPSFAVAKRLMKEGTIGELVSIEATGPSAQHQRWSYFLDRMPAWVVGSGDQPRRESGSSEFTGHGMAVTDDGMCVHFRPGAPGVRLSGEAGEMTFDSRRGWRLWRDVDVDGDTTGRSEVPWPTPNFNLPYGAIYCLDDVLQCLAGELDEPKNSGRRVGIALEVEVALKQSSAQGGARVDLPLADRSLGMHYDWFR